ncbi:MAG: LTA synthase family protein [Erysipelotrichaceae bacterium]|nr:LTA synthase family protein [Erysipelotrichaceae bacterium]
MNKNNKANVPWYILLYIASLVIAGITYVKKYFPLVNFEQILYGLTNMKGSSASGIVDGTIFTFSVGTLIFLILLVIYILLHNSKKVILIRIKYYSGFILLGSIIFTLYAIGVFEYEINLFKQTKIYDKYYVDGNGVDITFPDKKQNLIFIYMESMETTNASINNGGAQKVSYIPNLENYALKYDNFSSGEKLGGFVPVSGTTYTLAGMISQNSGVNFKLPINIMDKNIVKMNGVYALGDVLVDNGYKNYLMMGSQAIFASRDKYFKNHGNYEIFDYTYAINNELIPKDYLVWWGYEDNKLFEFAKNKLKDISKEEQPFNLTLLTADTHFTDGYLDSECDTPFDKKYANVMHCSDKMINDFITWVMEQDFYKNTTIVLVGDHLTMQSSFYDDIDKNYTRSVYNVFINSRVKSDTTKNRMFSSMDIYPTTLASLGVKIDGDRLGLGTNMYSNKKTLMEELGYKYVSNELKKRSSFYDNYIYKGKSND